jgi:hypothetical protein
MALDCHGGVRGGRGPDDCEEPEGGCSGGDSEVPLLLPVPLAVTVRSEGAVTRMEVGRPGGDPRRWDAADVAVFLRELHPPRPMSTLPQPAAAAVRGRTQLPVSIR